MLATILAGLKKELRVGMTTQDLADIARSELRSLGARPAFLGYQGYPDVLCVSMNDEVVHGIPDVKRIINDGDIVSMDLGVLYQDLITDGAISVIAGDSDDPRTRRLLSVSEQSLAAGIEAVRSGVSVGNISAAIQTVLDSQKYGIVRDLVGHGVGHEIHEPPNIPNYGHKGNGPHLKAGMTIAIEPMATLGTHAVKIAADGWTVLTADGSLAAHFEHTVLVTPDGAEILTIL